MDEARRLLVRAGGGRWGPGAGVRATYLVPFAGGANVLGQKRAQQ